MTCVITLISIWYTPGSNVLDDPLSIMSLVMLIKYFAFARRDRLALRVAQSYADRVEGGATVEQANAGSEPIRLLECFPGV